MPKGSISMSLVKAWLWSITVVILVWNQGRAGSVETTCEGRYDGGTIFAFGDSLTEGMLHTSVFRDKSTFHPYANKLRTFLPKTNIIESGVSGERVESMRKRLKHEIEKITMTKPTVVVILGGTNNIGTHSSVASTAKDVIGMHEDLKALKSDFITHTVAVTLPSFPMDHLREARLELNELIRKYAAQSNGFTLLLDIEDLFIMQPCKYNPKKNSKTVDVKCRDNKIPYDPENRKYWDHQSPLHFSVAGYDALGRIVYERLCEEKSYFYK